MHMFGEQHLHWHYVTLWHVRCCYQSRKGCDGLHAGCDAVSCNQRRAMPARSHPHARLARPDLSH